LDAATNIGAQELLDLHNEMTYNPRPAFKILLICIHPAAVGGDSLVGSTAEVTANVPDFVVDRFERRGGIKYK
jgi:hypothetical protein